MQTHEAPTSGGQVILIARLCKPSLSKQDGACTATGDPATASLLAFRGRQPIPPLYLRSLEAFRL